MKYFIVSRWRNRDNVIELIDKLKEVVGENVYSFYDFKSNIRLKEDCPEKVMEEFESLENWEDNKEVKNIFKEVLGTIKKSDAIILLLPAGKSTHIEIGIAYGLGKKCILIGEQKETETLYLIFDESYKSIDEFINSLK